MLTHSLLTFRYMYKKLSIAALLLTKAWWSIFSLTITCWQLLILQITLYVLLCWLLFNFGDSQKPKWPHWANVRILFFKGCVSVVLVGSIWFPSRGNLSPSVPTDDHVRMSSRNKQETLVGAFCTFVIMWKLPEHFIVQTAFFMLYFALNLLILHLHSL